MAQDLSRIVDFPTSILDHDDHQPYLVLLLLILLWENHMVVSVDVMFVVKSTNEHPYHHTVDSYNKVEWDGLRDQCGDGLGLAS